MTSRAFRALSAGLKSAQENWAGTAAEGIGHSAVESETPSPTGEKALHAEPIPVAPDQISLSGQQDLTEEEKQDTDHESADRGARLWGDFPCCLSCVSSVSLVSSSC